MKVYKKDMQLYVVTDRTWLGEKKLECEVEKICQAGATFIQLREKNITDDEFVKEALAIKKVTDKYKIPFVINDNVHVAKAVDADGVHIGQSDMEAKKARSVLGNEKIVGISAGSVEEALCAEKNGADYIGVGAVFHTDTKTDATSVTYDDMRKIISSVKIPVVAIGGIDKHNIMQLKGTGVSGVAVISAVFSADDVYEATAELLKLSGEMTKE
ncbi:MAG: thiamine phosphate synthase [Firmicutes bacterium]|nr:thiamine phosphate synthase [Bacillota bacterium]